MQCLLPQNVVAGDDAGPPHPKTGRSSILETALYGAVWYRLLLDEPLDDASQRDIKLARYSDRGLALAME